MIPLWNQFVEASQEVKKHFGIVWKPSLYLFTIYISKIMIMIIHLYSAFTQKGSNALWNESQGGETGHQPVKPPLTSAICPYMISPHYPENEYRWNNTGVHIPYSFSTSDVDSLMSPTNLVCRGQPSRNVPAAGDFAAYNEMSAAYFIVKFTNNKYKVSSAAYYSSHLAWCRRQGQWLNITPSDAII